MKLLLDEYLPRKMKFLFSGSGHQCDTVREAGFGGKENGELLSLADGRFEKPTHRRQESQASAKHRKSQDRNFGHPSCFE
jgi:hypothetical protein